MDSPSEHECKLKFAELLHRANDNEFTAMTQLCALYGWTDVTFQSTYAKIWAVDPIVKDELKRLKSITKTKEEAANYIWQTLEEARTATDYKAVASLGRLHAEMMGHIKKVNASEKNEGTEDNFDEMAYAVPEPSEPTLNDTVVVEADGKVEDDRVQPEVS